MKKLYVVFLFLFCNNYSSISQSITQNASGESSIFSRGSLISFDITQANLSFGINNLYSSFGKNTYIYGGYLSLKNEEGIGNLFSNGELVPASKLNGFFGYTFNSGLQPNFEMLQNENDDKLKKNTEEFKKIYLLDLVDYLLVLIDATNNVKEKNKLISLRDTLKNESIDNFKILLKDIETDLQNKIKAFYEPKIDATTNKYKELNKEKENLSNMRKDNSNFKQFMIFVIGGINSLKFNRFSGIDSNQLNKSFPEENFRGGQIGLGINALIGAWKFGLTTSWVQTNNFKILSKKEYLWKKTTTIENQTVTEEKKYTGYSGNYSKIDIYELKFDVIFNWRLNPNSFDHVLINPYFNTQFGSSNKDALPNSSDIGCGFYFLNKSGNFLGGFYVELQDINQEYEKIKPVSERNIRDPENRITFGIITKLSFDSLLYAF